MKLTTRYYGFFSSLTKKLNEEMNINDGCTVSTLVDGLTQVYGYKFRQLCFIRPLYSEKDYINIYVNTQDLNNEKIFPDGLDTKVGEGDIVTFGAVGGAA